MATWFTADTHFGHANIIGLSNRPFASLAEMDAALTHNWNAVVQPDDEVWHLGDFAFRNAIPAADYLRRLHGRIHLIWGNHDSAETRALPGWASSTPYVEISLEGRRLVLFHYALRVWNRSHNGAVHLYGHSHGSLAGDSQCCDVGVDNAHWAYRPVSLREIDALLTSQPVRLPVDHHID